MPGPSRDRGFIRGEHEGGQTDAAAVAAPNCASQARVALRYALPTSPAWLSATASARSISHSTAQDRETCRDALFEQFLAHPEASGRDCRSGAQAEEVPAFAGRLTPAGGGG